MIRLRSIVAKAVIDWHIGWHQGRAADHLTRERVWRRKHEDRWPRMFR